MQQETTVSIDAKNAEKIELSDKKVFTSKHEKVNTMIAEIFNTTN